MTAFEAVLFEESARAFALTYSAPIGRVLAEIEAFDKATKLPVRPWVIGECCDHIYPTCPAVVRTGRLDAKDNWRLGRYETVDDPDKRPVPRSRLRQRGRRRLRLVLPRVAFAPSSRHRDPLIHDLQKRGPTHDGQRL